MVVIESLPAPERRGATRPAATEPVAPEPVEVLDGDRLVLRLGGVGGLGGLRRPADGPAENQVPVPDPGSPRAPTVPRPIAPPTDDPRDFHVVQPGDTLSQIAERHLGSAQHADELARLNGLSDPSALRVGQVLRLR